MAEFDKMLSSLSAEDIAEAAAELLERLYPYGGTKAAGETARENESEAEKRGQETFAGETAREIRRRGELGAENGGRQRENRTAAEREMRRTEIFETPAALVTESGKMHFGHDSASVHMQDGARALSDFFRRDSRRYDREFQRY